MNKELAFSVFCVENYKVHRSLTGKQVCELFDQIREFYDVLHTTSFQFMNHDIDLYLQARCAELPTS